MHARNHAAGLRPALPELRLQVVDRNFAFRDCNYSLYSSWLAYPWANAHLVIRGTNPYSLDRRERSAPRGEAAMVASMLESSSLYSDGLDEAAVAAALLDFARSSPRPAKALLNLNPGSTPRKLSGQLSVFGCRIASAGRGGELATLGGLDFQPGLSTEPGGPARGGGLRVRRRILIAPGTRVHFVLPQALAEAAQKRPRPGIRIEQVELLPSVFTDSGSFRSLWPDGPQPRLGGRYSLRFGAGPDGTLTVMPQAGSEDATEAALQADPAA